MSIFNYKITYGSNGNFEIVITGCTPNVNEVARLIQKLEDARAPSIEVGSIVRLTVDFVNFKAGTPGVVRQIDHQDYVAPFQVRFENETYWLTADQIELVV